MNITAVDSENSLKEHVVLFTGYNKPEVTQLGMGASNCAVLDSACSSTVFSRDWMENYVDSLGEVGKESVKRLKGLRCSNLEGEQLFLQRENMKYLQQL